MKYQVQIHLTKYQFALEKSQRFKGYNYWPVLIMINDYQEKYKECACAKRVVHDQTFMGVSDFAKWPFVMGEECLNSILGFVARVEGPHDSLYYHG